MIARSVHACQVIGANTAFSYNGYLFTMPNLWIIIAGLIVVWLIATVLKFTVGGLINILLLIAVGLAIYHFLKKK